VAFARWDRIVWIFVGAAPGPEDELRARKALTKLQLNDWLLK